MLQVGYYKRNDFVRKRLSKSVILMRKEEIYLADIERILFGQTPPLFLVEVFLRTVIIYIILLVVVRLLGKRMSGQLTITEMAVMLTLGAVVAPVMQLPDRGLLIGVLILFCTLLFQRGINWLAFRRSGVERVTQGQMCLLVKDGVLQLDQMRKSRITRQQVFANLRGKEIYNLGEVQRVYLEACGIFSVYRFENSRPGLALLPPKDKSINDETNQVGDELLTCSNCGNTEHGATHRACSICGSFRWTDAMAA